MKELALLLPDGYDPRDDNGRGVVELFLDEDEPPTRVKVEPLDDGRWAAVACWEP